ncbi:MAG TPA: nucleoside-diphosphate kinase [Polyangiaceae bacterium]|jgi:nucleoside-diphosphate kinase|nr:nucleoside-diphosphate kinase [Polyangiaceae bacterium]
MAVERTLCIIKPDAVEKKHAGAILAHLEAKGFDLVAVKKTHLSRAVAEGFYAVHKARPFFGELCDFMTRGPVVVAVLQKDNAVAEYRAAMGATDPAKAEAGTIRKLYAASIGENAVHGSDSLDNAKIEIAYFFAASEVAPVA